MTIVERISRRLRYGKPIIIVSALPRSGTSMLMNGLPAGGVPLSTDGIRRADVNNPRGYFEYEKVKALENHGDLAWLPGARGKAVKVISFLLSWLPETCDYQVIFMQRHLDEIIASQDRMLSEREETSPRTGDARTRDLYTQHLREVAELLARRNCFRTLSISYGDAVKDPIRRDASAHSSVDRSIWIAWWPLSIESCIEIGGSVLANFREHHWIVRRRA